ncbi:hypothetical protein Bbelb_070310 [Branchiostoma belcheri]|nr:hypothetical protein Bbelb_070310 [Branchiostoma belcheri]
MYCEDFVDRKWMKTMERRKRDMQALDKMREDASREQEQSKLVALSQDSEESEAGSQKIETDVDACFSSCDESIGVCDEDTSKEELPLKYQHIRESIRKVRSEFYESVDKLQSCYHMSKAQASAAVIVVGNYMFGRRWKAHDESDRVDLDTLPASSSVRYAGKSIEMLALYEIVKEMMDSDEQKQGAGSFSVQGITVKGKYRSLPTLSIASESRQNLADLKVAKLQILKAASGVAAKTLFEKMDFVLTDQTSHNFNVDELVAESLESEHIPDHLFCKVHQTLMFNRVITKLWAQIENTLGRDKIYSNFLVNATTSATSVTEQALDCMTRLINHDFDHKPWNKSRDFDIHIAPRPNKSVSLKDERFNRLTLTCAVSLYHLNDVASFLRNKIIPAFQQLYQELVEVDPTTLLQAQEPAFKFISKERHQQTKYDEEICSAVVQVATTYQAEVTKLLGMLLPKLASGFQKQKGDIFGFGEHDVTAQNSVTQMDKEKLEKAPIHNLDAERSVGFVNFELSRRGAKQLKVASAAQVKAKSSDLIARREAGAFRNYSKELRKGGRIPEIVLAWNRKQEELKKQGLQDKDIANVAVDRRRIKDLQSLKKMGGLFTSAADVDSYVAAGDVDDATKLGRLYLEVCYA